MREQKLFNSNWQFVLSDEEPNENAEWRVVTLPHDWSMDYDLSETAMTGGGGGYAQAGIGWYRKEFYVGELISTQKMSLLFEGVYMNTTVYLNGVEMAHHNYGYTPFSVDLDDNLQVGKNVILVKVDNSLQPNSRWYSGSGIYRDVYFIKNGDIHISPWGVRCCTNTLKDDFSQAVLLIRTSVENESSNRKVMGVLHEIVDAEGDKVLTSGTSVIMEPGSKCECESRPEMNNPHLWSVDAPYMYKLITRIKVDDEIVDEITVDIGVRTATFDCDKGFLLNGSSVKIKGMCVHHDCGMTGAVGYRDVWERRLVKLKEMGCNGIRCSHNPPEPVLLELCDKLGFLVMDEIFDEWFLIKHKNNNYYSQQFAYGSGMFFAEDAEKNIVTMLRRDFNHPSVILWSIGNEIPEQSSLDGVDIIKFLQGICHKEDVSRMVTSACDNIVSGSAYRTLREFENELDVVGYNYVNRWRDRAETFYEEDRFLYPKRRICGSEHPSVGGERGKYGKGYATATLHHEPLWRFTISHDYVAGDYLWTGIDHLGETRWPRRGAGCGALDTAGLEKDSYYYFMSIWNKEKHTLHILPHWNWEGEEGQFKQVVCYTDYEEVELFINGKSAGRKGMACPRYGAVNNWYERNGVYATTNDLHLTWDIPYEPGEIKAVAYINGEVAEEKSIHTTKDAVKLNASVWNKKLPVGGIFQIEVSAEDTDNRFVPTCEEVVECKVEGPAHLIGMDNGNLWDLSRYSIPSRKLMSGKLLTMLQADGTGEVVVTFASANLKEIKVILNVL